MNKEINETSEAVETLDTENIKMSYKVIKSKPDSLGTIISKELKRPNGGYLKTILFMLITAPLLFWFIYVSALPKIKHFDETQKVPYKGVEIDVKMGDDLTLDYDVKNATIKIGDNKYIEIDEESLDKILNIDLNITNNKFFDNGIEVTIPKEVEVSSFDNYNNMLYAVCYNENKTGLRELLISDTIVADLNLDGMESIDGETYEKNDNKSVAAFKRTYESATIYYGDQLLDGEIGTKTLANRVNTLEDSLKYSVREEGQGEEVIVHLDELADLKLSELSFFKDAPGIYYSEADGVLRLYNYKDDMTYLFITYVNNQAFYCKATDLLETNYYNLFVTKGFDDPESTGYRTFVITTNNNMYAFRINEDADESVLDEILEKFGYNRETISIKTVQEVVPANIVEDSVSNNTMEEIIEDANLTEAEAN